MEFDRTDDREGRIRERATALREQESRPEDHWRQANQEMGDDESRQRGTLAAGSGSVPQSGGAGSRQDSEANVAGTPGTVQAGEEDDAGRAAPTRRRQQG